MELLGLFKITVVSKQGWMHFLEKMVLPVVGNKALTLLLYNLKKKKGEMVGSSRFGLHALGSHETRTFRERD